MNPSKRTFAFGHTLLYSHVLGVDARWREWQCPRTGRIRVTASVKKRGERDTAWWFREDGVSLYDKGRSSG